MKETIEKHIRDNYKTYIILIIIFTGGLIAGIVAVNNLNLENKEKINYYLIDFTNNLRDNNNINYGLLLTNSLKKNFKFIIILIVLSFSIWRKISNSILMGYKGFTLGYSISSAICIFGIGKGIVFNISLLLLSELIFIPTLLFTAVFCMHIYSDIINRNCSNRNNYRIRNLVIFIIILLNLLVASLTKTYLSSNLFIMINNYF